MTLVIPFYVSLMDLETSFPRKRESRGGEAGSLELPDHAQFPAGLLVVVELGVGLADLVN